MHHKGLNRLILLLLFLSLGKTSIAQGDSSSPITVKITLEKHNSVRLPKSYFSSQIARGDLYVKTDSVNEEQYDIEITLKNNSPKTISIWLMSCSWSDNFLVNNNYMYMHGIECDGNFPILVRFQPGEFKIYKTTLSKSIKFENPCECCIYGPQVEATKLGLIIVDDIYQPKLEPIFGYLLAMHDKSLWQIVWSNPLYLLNN